jgi:hypothetical protein
MLSRKHRISSVVATFLFACCVPPLSADVVIDNFSEITASWPVLRTTVGTTVRTDSPLSTSNVIGGVRRTTIHLDAIGGPPNNQTTDIDAANEILTYFSATGDNGRVELFYDGGTGDLNADVSNETQFTIFFIDFDHAGAINMPVTVTFNDGTTSFSVTKTLTSAVSNFGQVYLLSEFIGVDFTSINTITVLLDPGSAADFTLSFLALTRVPEPATLTLAALGMVGATGIFYRRNRKVAV